MKELEKKIIEYTSNLLYLHDMAPWRTKRNQEIMDKIITRCMKDLEEHQKLVEMLQNEKQIEYFVRQTILYMI